MTASDGFGSVSLAAPPAGVVALFDTAPATLRVGVAVLGAT